MYRDVVSMRIESTEISLNVQPENDRFFFLKQKHYVTFKVNEHLANCTTTLKDKSVSGM